MDSNDSTKNSINENVKTYFLHVFFSEGAKMENIRASLLISKLSQVGTVNRSIPTDPEGNDDAKSFIIENGLYISLSSVLTREEIEYKSKDGLSVESTTFMKKLPDDKNSI
jgi:two-component system chemotaxis sensor kinase CheA